MLPLTPPGLNLRFISKHLKSARGMLVFASCLLFLQAILITTLPWPILILIDHVLIPLSRGVSEFALSWVQLGILPLNLGPTQALIWSAGFLTLLAVSNTILDIKQDALVGATAQRVVESVRTELLSHLMTCRQSYIDNRRRIDIVARISSDTASLELLIVTGLRTLLKSVPILCFVLIVTLFIEPRFSLIAATSLPLIYFLVRFFSHRSRNRLKSLRSETALFEQDAEHTISTLATIKSLNLENTALEVLLEHSRKMSENTLNVHHSQGRMTASLHLIKNILRALAVLIGGTAVARGELTLGSLILLIAYCDTISKPVQDLAQFASIHSRALASLERINDLYDELRDKEETQGAVNTSSLPFPDATALHFENVSFAFEDGAIRLEEFSADFQGGELIGVIGPSGVGKSTLGRLMNRLIDPIEGRILLGRTDLRRYRLQLLRNIITLVRDEPYLIEGTVRENLLLGLPDDQNRPDESEISEALNLANASEFVGSLSNRLDTVIGGEFGNKPAAKLTFDQVKRIHLARAFLRINSRVFVFDHPTAELDSESATLIFESVRRLTNRGALVFWITHRLEDMAECDRVIFYNSRHPVIGTSQELFENNATYRAYINRSRRTPPGGNQLHASFLRPK
jgi:ATP-binding cassette subfamily B protein